MLYVKLQVIMRRQIQSNRKTPVTAIQFPNLPAKHSHLVPSFRGNKEDNTIPT